MITPEIQNFVKNEIARSQEDALYSTKNVAAHYHNGIDSPKITSTSSVSTSINGSASGSGVTSIANTTDTLLTPTKEFANGITWDSTNHQFKILTAGQYLVVGLVTYQTSADGSLYQTEIFLNGNVAAKSYSQAGAAGLATGLCVSKIIDLAVGDLIQLYTWQNSGISTSIYSNSDLTYLCVAKV